MYHQDVNYITEMNKLYAYCISKKSSKSEIALLHALYMINNAEDWKIWFEADNELIQRLTGGLSRESINEARNKLKQKGRIDFKDGVRNTQSAKYTIILFDSDRVKSDMKVDKEVDMKVDIPVDKEVDTLSKQNETKQDKKNNTKKSSSALSKKFVPPTVEQVIEYCRERNLTVDPQHFFNNFDVSGWIDSKGNPVLNWKQKLLTWESFGNKSIKNEVSKTEEKEKEWY